MGLESGFLLATDGDLKRSRLPFNGDRCADLAIGVPLVQVGSATSAGAVNILFGESPAGLTATGSQLWTQDLLTAPDDPESDDHFGAALAVGDFDGDSFRDLAIGVRTRIWGAPPMPGWYRSGTGPAAASSAQNVAGVQGMVEVDDRFGYALAAGDFNGDSFDRLAIGAPRGPQQPRPSDAGAVPCSSARCPAWHRRRQIWHQEVAGCRTCERQ
jgi:hypothetical protein